MPNDWNFDVVCLPYRSNVTLFGSGMCTTYHQPDSDFMPNFGKYQYELSPHTIYFFAL